MTKEQATELLRKYQSGECTLEEKVFLDHWYLSEATKQVAPELLPDALHEEQLIWNRILEEIPAKDNVRRLKKWHSIAAASILIFLSFGTYLLLKPKTASQNIVNNQPFKNDIAPGTNKAILTLAGGRQVILTGAKNGTIAKQGLVAISKTGNGKIVYNAASTPTNLQDASVNAGNNTITTPRGGQYRVVLPDGSEVLLNAASSLTYPTAFIGNERKVELTGEAYFEVAHNAAKPFKVYSKGQVVEVLGTHFNINSYDDEPGIKTTLLEGKVKVTDAKKNQNRFLQPGQQSFLSIDAFNVNTVDTEEAVAWKNGIFMFEGDDIQQIMRMISRWYDVDITYKGTAPVDLFSGSVSRFSNVSEVLNLLHLTGKVKFSIEGRKIIVYK